MDWDPVTCSSLAEEVEENLYCWDHHLCMFWLLLYTLWQLAAMNQQHI